jgi:hypothetical protein
MDKIIELLATLNQTEKVEVAKHLLIHRRQDIEKSLIDILSSCKPCENKVEWPLFIEELKGQREYKFSLNVDINFDEFKEVCIDLETRHDIGLVITAIENFYRIGRPDCKLTSLQFAYMEIFGGGAYSEIRTTNLLHSEVIQLVKPYTPSKDIPAETFFCFIASSN